MPSSIQYVKPELSVPSQDVLYAVCVHALLTLRLEVSIVAISPLFEVAGSQRVAPWQSDPQLADAAAGATPAATAAMTTSAAYKCDAPNAAAAGRRDQMKADHQIPPSWEARLAARAQPRFDAVDRLCPAQPASFSRSWRDTRGGPGVHRSADRPT